MFNAEHFCLDFSIDSPKGGKHSRPGWIQVECPFCTGHYGYHLGININRGYANCWRCGWHWLPKVISKITNKTIYESKQIITKYSSGDTFDDYQSDVQTAQKLIYPSEFQKLKPVHYNYLKSRGFKPSFARKLGLLGTDWYGEYSWRVIIPVWLDGELISYQGRDITGRASLKYKACAKVDETYHHQNMIYGIDDIKGDTIIIVEGVFDAWKLYGYAGATFGSAWTPSQARMIASRFKKFYSLYDPEEQAQENADKLAKYLTARGLEGENLVLDLGTRDDGYERDPGDMSEKETNELLGELGIL
jgi:DNA primase